MPYRKLHVADTSLSIPKAKRRKKKISLEGDEAVYSSVLARPKKCMDFCTYVVAVDVILLVPSPHITKPHNAIQLVPAFLQLANLDLK